MTVYDFENLFDPILYWVQYSEEEITKIKETTFADYTPTKDVMLVDAYIELLSNIVYDYNNYIDFYCWDCDFGRSPKTVNIYGQEFVFDSLSNLWNAIQFLNQEE